MSTDFATLQALSIPEGVVTQITDAAGNVLWAISSGSDTVILEVEKITSDTYAAETTYENEQFILLDIYPKTNGTVSVTYGGLTKTITDTSGAEEPNAQQVFFGTFNGVSDSVTTPDSGTLTIEGDYYAFATGAYETGKISLGHRCYCVTAVNSFGQARIIPANAFGGFVGCPLTSIVISNNIISIGDYAFNSCASLTSATIGNGVTRIGINPFTDCASLTSITVEDGNPVYHSSGNCIIETESKTLIAGCSTSVIPDDGSVTSIGAYVFRGSTFTSINIPDGVTSIGKQAFYACSRLASINIPDSVTSIGGYAFYDCTSLTSVIFTNTSGWYVTETEGGDASTGTAVDVSDASNNVTLITDTYRTYYWYRS